MFRVNEFRLPYMKYMLERARVLFHSRYVGFINSDILVAPNLFDTLTQAEALVEKGALNPKASIVASFHCSTRFVPRSGA